MKSNNQLEPLLGGRLRGGYEGWVWGEGIARGATVIAGLTILSRLLGLVRTLVFSQTVGAAAWARRTSPRTRSPTCSTSWSWAVR
jgi:hypothetical protein